MTVVGGLAVPAAAAAPRHNAIVDPGLAAAVGAGQEATFFVVVDGRTDLSGAAGCEASTRHGHRWSDRDRPTARRDYRSHAR
ncbi:hypothetical protein [Micromonospora sp. IBHARD004]|uniref:hypothetical protein n=1 Tax=Micromonospora sp. IBHARD004 TaxID=3457764 RepID=UPI0040599E07